MVSCPVVSGLFVATQLKEDEILAASAILIPAPLQTFNESVMVSTGAGFKVTLMVCALPVQPAKTETGVTV